MHKIIADSNISLWRRTHRVEVEGIGYVESDIPLDIDFITDVLIEARFQAEIAFAKTVSKLMPQAPGQVFLGEIKLHINLNSSLEQ